MNISFKLESLDTYRNQIGKITGIPNKVSGTSPSEDPFFTTIQLKKIAAVATAALAIIVATVKLATYLASGGALLANPWIALGCLALAVLSYWYYANQASLVDLESRSKRRELSDRLGCQSFSYQVQFLHNRGITIKEAVEWRLLSSSTTEVEYSTFLVLGQVYEQALNAQEDMKLHARRSFDPSIFTTLASYHNKLVKGGE